MKVICVRLTSGEEIIGRMVEEKGFLTEDVKVSQYDNELSPWDPTGKLTLKMVRGITAQPINKNEMAIAFFPWSLGNQDGVFTLNLDQCAAAVYPAEAEVEAGYLQQTSNIQIARSTPGIKM